MSDSFSSLGVPSEITERLTSLGISSPFPIQSATLQDSLAGRDLFAQSPTGSGKTLAFAIPIVARVGRARPGRPRGLVLAPTRELAAQITDATRPLAGVMDRRVAAFYGGVGYGAQLAALRRGVDVVVGCPGRLIDLLDRRSVNFADVEVVVIDEADRLADMGFLPAVRRLLDEVRGPRQTMLFSATLTREVDQLVRDYQDAPRRHVLEQPSHHHGTRSHEFWTSTREGRAELTARLVAGHYSSIVFCRTRHGADRLARQLSRANVAAVAIHGDRSQSQRDRALAEFRDGRAQVLVGTDVASRGIHVEGVDCVVHFDPPEDAETYVHRSGRTGRAGSSGRVVSLITPEQQQNARRLQRSLGLRAELAAPPEMTDVLTPVVRPAAAAIPQRPERRPNRPRRPDQRRTAGRPRQQQQRRQRNGARRHADT